MHVERHLAAAERIARSLHKCRPHDVEMRIEGAMLAGSHWLNAALHRVGATRFDADVMHTYLLTINEFRRLCVAQQDAMHALRTIEDLRAPFVRGNWPGGMQAADRAIQQLNVIRARCTLVCAAQVDANEEEVR